MARKFLIASILILVSVWIAFQPAVSRAQETLTCPWAARADAQGEIGNIRALEYLNSCIAYRLGEADAAPGTPPPVTEPASCHEKSGLLALNPDSLTRDDLLYLKACVNADLKTFRETE